MATTQQQLALYDVLSQEALRRVDGDPLAWRDAFLALLEECGLRLRFVVRIQPAQEG